MIAQQLSAMLARALADSPRAQALCRELEGRTLRLEVGGWPQRLDLVVQDGGLQPALQREGANLPAADITLRGSPVALAMLAASGPEAALSNPSLEVSGDEHLAQRFRELLRLLRPDFEATLARAFGRVPAHLATRAIGGFASWSRDALDSLARNGADYLAHETGDLVSRAESDAHYADVAGLAAGTRALEARLATLDARVAATAERKP